ncbi:methyltransferase GidB [Paracoccus aminophilus JCM 7686]|uniref:Ribosomal RNA small subunit methyltransferase G n=1 Tax=Paracoccus aminophilus JCM 7686 TaxID=1367847 RepID=S5YPE4_PARAH|nr:methyltransferase GidB [Paracoccus aminophilus JCM 7686]
MDVSRETARALAQYCELVRKWNPRINLVAAGSLLEFEERHLRDSLQLVDLSAKTNTNWVDLGSGGGLPGLVVAISRPDLEVKLIESDRRKAEFLRTVCRELGLKNCAIVAQRIEAVDRLDVANISARALAALPLLMSYVSRHLAEDGTAWLMKGRNWHAEVEEARKTWRFDLISHPSLTDENAAILEIRRIEHV